MIDPSKYPCYHCGKPSNGNYGYSPDIIKMFENTETRWCCENCYNMVVFFKMSIFKNRNQEVTQIDLDAKRLEQINKQIRHLQCQANQIEASKVDSFTAYIKSLVWIKDCKFTFEEQQYYCTKYKLTFNFADQYKAPYQFYGCVVFGDEKNYERQVRFKFEPYGSAVFESSDSNMLAKFIEIYGIKIENADTLRSKAYLYTELLK